MIVCKASAWPLQGQLATNKKNFMAHGSLKIARKNSARVTPPASRTHGQLGCPCCAGHPKAAGCEVDVGQAEDMSDGQPDGTIACAWAGFGECLLAASAAAATACCTIPSWICSFGDEAGHASGGGLAGAGSGGSPGEVGHDPGPGRAWSSGAELAATGIGLADF
mmetsp:Transcript_102509/g.182133  ORF Transcript_102509/g.182133 Transcript_102509/m.182133 type:complete len:165 (-) Transcript_102509:1264-1758(-)